MYICGQIAEVSTRLSYHGTAYGFATASIGNCLCPEKIRLHASARKYETMAPCRLADDHKSCFVAFKRLQSQTRSCLRPTMLSSPGDTHCAPHRRQSGQNSKTTWRAICESLSTMKERISDLSLRILHRSISCALIGYGTIRPTMSHVSKSFPEMNGQPTRRPRNDYRRFGSFKVTKIRGVVAGQYSNFTTKRHLTAADVPFHTTMRQGVSYRPDASRNPVHVRNVDQTRNQIDVACGLDTNLVFKLVLIP